MNIGYARTSTADQSQDLQTDALRKAGCERIYTDVASGAKASRPQLDIMLAQLRPGDTVTVWKLDRLGRSLHHLIEVIEMFKATGITFCSLTENIDTSTASGMAFFQMFGVFAEFELNLKRERTNAGLRAARERGRIGGRPKGLSKDAETKSHAAASLYTAGKLSVEEICEQLTIGKSTLYRYLRERGVQIGK
jgi:DNA invertase Pin-like site-specific DNA recombinase